MPLAPYTTLGVGGPARYFAGVGSQGELLEALAFAKDKGVPVFILGGGSNLLVADEGYPGLVIHAVFRDPYQNEPAEFFEPASSPGTMRASVAAGCVWDDFVLRICQQGISGVECLAGIPGLIGGSPIQNIGAYGQEVSSTILSVTAIDLETLDVVVLGRDACRFGYRSSLFNTTRRNRYVVTAVDFQFDLAARPKLTYADLVRHFGGGTPTPLEIYHAVRTIRRGKGMLLVEGDPDSRSAGSFFKNPVVGEHAVDRIAAALAIASADVPRWPAGPGMVKLPAAWLVERAGFPKGFAMGRAGISSRHTLALINRGGATAEEIMALRDAIVGEVQSRFGIVLEQEPVQLG